MSREKDVRIRLIANPQLGVSVLETSGKTGPLQESFASRSYLNFAALFTVGFLVFSFSLKKGKRASRLEFSSLPFLPVLARALCRKHPTCASTAQACSLPSYTSTVATTDVYPAFITTMQDLVKAPESA